MYKALHSFLKLYWIPVLSLIGLATYLVFVRTHTSFAKDLPLIVVILTGGLPLLWDTVQSLRKKRFNVDIIAIASIFGGLLVGEYLPAAIIVLMMSGGEALERFALRRASGALASLLARSPRQANRWNGQEYEEVSVEAVQEGDQLLLKPGESVPVDAEVIEGTSDIDEALLTGESMPVAKVIGDEVLSGSINMTSPLTIRAIAPAEKSTFAKITQLVQEAQGKKADFQELADRFGSWFSVVVLIFVAVTWWLTKSSDLAYAVLVIATPCPLILATPIAVIAGIGRAAKLGIIVKSGRSLEALARARAVLFDKTGTLTRGQMSVEKIVIHTDEYAEPEILRVAAALEKYSNHVIARSILSEIKHRQLTVPEAYNLREIPAHGLLGDVEEKAVLVGNDKLLESQKVSIAENPTVRPGEVQLFVAIEGLHIATISLLDQVREESPTVIQKLKEYGIKEIVMLTGDRAEVAKKIAHQLGIHHIEAGLLPADKLRAVERIVVKEHQSRRTVVMVGDGINDAPALERADIGVAIGKQGGEVAVEAADIVLLGEQLARLIDGIRIGRAVLRIASQGIWFGMGCSFIGMGAAALGYLPPLDGALLQEVIDVLVIFNALRVLGV